MSKFDTHAHVFIKDLPLAKNCRYVPDYNATVKDYLAHLDQHGIDVGILIQPSFLGTDNHFLLNALEQYPHRLRGVVVVAPDISLLELQQMAAIGVIGIRLNLIGLDLPDFTTPAWQSLLTHIKQLNWHVELHRPAKDLPTLITPLLQSGVKIVVDHFGLPDMTLRQNDPGFQFLLNHAETGQIWVKLSAGYRNSVVNSIANSIANSDMDSGGQSVAPLIPLLLTHFGGNRLLWGSDWPHTRFEETINYDLAVNLFEQWITDKAMQHQILTQAPQELITVK